MNKWEAAVARSQLNDEKAVIAELEKQYKAALKDIDTVIKLLSADQSTQSRVYQMQYQKALREQINGILTQLHGQNFTSIQQYLNECYNSGYIGTMYSIHGQGIPIIAPINQDAVTRAVMTDSKLSEPLYESLGHDIKALKKTITGEVTRGVASNTDWTEIARNIELDSGIPFRRAQTIVRTEGHRIQQEASADARSEAKARGCDVVKQWDSTLDSKTRDTHRQLDGQIREVDELFEIDGKKADMPGAFGDPAEDINCRCVALTRARWGLDEAELATMKERAEFFGLDKSDSFEEFEKKFLKMPEDAETAPMTEAAQTVMQVPSTLSNIDESIEWAQDEMAANFETYRGLPEEYHAPFDKFEELTPHFEEQMSAALQKFDFSSNTDSVAVEHILEDGKLKGTMETNTSNGVLDLKMRKGATEQLFGLYDTIEDLSPSEFEKYGCLDTPDRAKELYGECRIVFKKENMWDRTTFTVGDSLAAYADGGYRTPSKVSDPKIVSFDKDPFSPSMPDVNETAIKLIPELFDTIEEHGYFAGPTNSQDYIELQFHGDVTLDDIAYIEVPQSSKNLTEILDLAEEKGVKIKVKKR